MLVLCLQHWTSDKPTFIQQRLQSAGLNLYPGDYEKIEQPLHHPKKKEITFLKILNSVEQIHPFLIILKPLYIANTLRYIPCCISAKHWQLLMAISGNKPNLHDNCKS